MSFLFIIPGLFLGFAIGFWVGGDIAAFSSGVEVADLRKELEEVRTELQRLKEEEGVE